MKRERPVIPQEKREEHIQDRTYWQGRALSDFLHRAIMLRDDPEKNERLAAQLCRLDYYGGRGMAGQAMTEYNCEHCGLTDWWGNTNVPRVCRSCAVTLKLCTHCGGDINL